MQKFLKARLRTAQTIEVIVYGPLIHEDRERTRLRVNYSHLFPVTLIKEEVKQALTILTFRLHEPLLLGNAYEVIIESFGSTPIDVTDAMALPEYQDEFIYTGDDLGATYTPTSTTFKVWAPLASSVYIKLFKGDHNHANFPMVRQKNGVYVITLEGDYDGHAYLYDVTNHGITLPTLDPYAIGSTRNSVYSVVINRQRLAQLPSYDEKLPPIKSPTDAILYEAHVRDLTSALKTTIDHKGRFLGFLEKGKTHVETHQPVGWDYFTALGFTHLQLLPVNDYRSVDEMHVETSYNWGYDPYQYFAVEGSFASNLDDPYSRIEDFKRLVSTCHQHGIRVNLDVVFNHVYEFQYSIFEKVVPGFYFRKRADGTMSNGSFCGNDLASEKPMVRHLILSAARYWVSMFHIDGFRFDLMGILDQTTMRMLAEQVQAIRPDFMLYGEGWNMPTELPHEEKTITDHHAKLPQISFFNDQFRNAIKGGNFENDILVPGFASGRTNTEGLIGLWFGSCLPSLGIHKVSFPYQSINYIECHDNGTFYDKLIRLYPTAPESVLKNYIQLSLSLILFAQGIPFIHMGQEIGGTKFGDHNSYKSGDVVNQFQVDRLVEYEDVIQTLKDLIQLRKAFPELRYPHPLDPQHIQSTMLPEGGLQLKVTVGSTSLLWLVNLSEHPVPSPSIDATYTLYFDGRKRLETKQFPSTISPLSVYFFTVS